MRTAPRLRSFRRSHRCGWVVLWLGALVAATGMLSAATGREGVVRTTEGATLRGVVEFTAKGLRVVPAGGEAVGLPLEQLIELTLAEPPREAEGTNPAPATATVGDGGGALDLDAGQGLTNGWTAHSVGPGAQGKFTADPKGWVVDAVGLGLRGSTDSFLLVERRLEVSGQVVSALTSLTSTNSEAMAGLMLRDNLGEAAAYAFLGLRVGSGISFQYRQIASGMTMRVTNTVMALPAWLRLSRLGGSVVAELSADGREWQVFARANVNLGQNSRAGIAVASGSETEAAAAGYREPSVGAAGLGYAPAAGYPRVLLRGGSVLVSPVTSADESVLRLGGSLAGSAVSLLNVARIEFVPTTPEIEARIEPARAGLILTDGDFLDGSVRSIATNTVTMSSLLFGFRRYTAGSEAAAVQLGIVEPEEAPFRIQLRNGSELRARRLIPGVGTVRAESPLLGSFEVPLDTLRSVRRAGFER